jgi:adenine deaminase
MSRDGGSVRDRVGVPGDSRDALLHVAAGKRPADLVVRGGVLANVYTGELLDGWGVAAAGSRIALIGPDADSCIGPSTTVVEARGQVIAPGFVDGHTHLDFLHRLDRYLESAIPTGLTAFVTETPVLCAAGGFPAVEAFLAHLARLPITGFATAPTIAYLCSDRGDGQPTITLEEMARLLEEPAVLGLGEVYWPALMAGRPDLVTLIAKAEALGKCVDGHTAGARGKKLVGLAAAGISSCHEPITPDEVQARLRLGLYTMIRDGSVRRDLPALRGALTGMSPRRLMLASDGAWAEHLVTHGYLDESARQAVRFGLSPMQTLQAITLVPAERFNVDDRLGGLAPGRQADLVLLPDLQEFRPRLVIARGQVVAADGRVAVAIPPPTFSATCPPPPRTARPLRADDFRIPAIPGRERVRVRVIHLAAEIVTEAVVREVAVRNGAVEADPTADLLKIVAFDRHGAGQCGHGLLSGFGLSRGAVATSVSFDTVNLVVVGANDADMLLAAERMLALGGGLVAAADGTVRAEVPLPLGGIISERTMPALREELVAFRQALHQLGCVRADPVLTVQILTFTAIPALRIRERGLLDVRENRVVPLILDEGET